MLRSRSLPNGVSTFSNGFYCGASRAHAAMSGYVRNTQAPVLALDLMQRRRDGAVEARTLFTRWALTNPSSKFEKRRERYSRP
jgi:hypothetical protein